MSDVHDKICNWLNLHLGWHGTRFMGALSGGNSNLTWRFGDEHNVCVVRTPPAESISSNSARGIERESKVLNLVAGRVKAPKIYGWCDDLSVIGRPFLVQEWVDGVSITDVLPSHYSDPVKATNLLGEDLMRQLAAVHSIEWPAEGLETLGRPDNFVVRQIDRWTKVRSDTAVRELPLFFELSSWLTNNRPETERPALIHGDYHLDNTLADPHEPRINAIIDWELATVGDPSMDVALALLFWGDNRSSAPPAFGQLQAISRAPGVVDRHHLAALWADLTGRSLQHMNYYIALASWRLAGIVEGAYCLYEQGKVQSEYASALEYNVPALLRDAERAASGDW